MARAVSDARSEAARVREALGASVRRAASVLTPLALLELLVFVPTAGLLQPQLWGIEAFGMGGVAVAVGVAGALLARALRSLGVGLAALADPTLALLSVVVLTLHLRHFPQKLLAAALPPPSSQLLGAAAVAIGSLIAFVGWSLLSSRLGVRRSRVTWPLVASLALPVALSASRRAGAVSEPGDPRLVLTGVVTLLFAATIAVAFHDARRGAGAVRSFAALVAAGVLFRVVTPSTSDLLVASPPEVPLPHLAAPPVFFVVLDTFRADALDLRPAGVSATPQLARFASAADVYPAAIANASWTLPGHASLLTGRYVAHHATDETSEAGFAPYLSPSIPLLHEILARHGYRTACYTANGFVGPTTGLSRGCQRYRNPNRIDVTKLLPLRLLGLTSSASRGDQALADRRGTEVMVCM